MANETSTTTLATLQPKIIREAMFVAQEQTIMRNLVRNFPMPAYTGKTVNVPFYPELTAASVAELTDLENQAVSTTEKTLTIGEAGLMVTISDMSVNTSADNVVASIGRQAGLAIAKKIEKDLLAKFAGFSQVVGSNATKITVAHIAQAVAKLRSQGITSSEIFCVLHPNVAYDLIMELTAAGINPNGGDLQNEAMRNGFISRILGVQVFQSSNIEETAGDSVGGLFVRDAIGFALAQDVKVEFERNASLRATEMVVTAVYATGELVDQYGVALSFDSSIAA